MKKRYPLVKTKFMLPLIRYTNVHRPLLIRKMRQIEEVPVTLIHSGPGYGKSSAIASYLDGQDRSYCWYTLSKHDDHFIPFLINMIYSIQTTYPDFGQVLLDYVSKGDFDQIEEEVDFLSSEFINELLLLNEEFTIVLDDIHFVEASINSRKWVSLLIEFIPKHIHLVLCGRIRPTWDVLTRLLVHGELLELTETDLAFSKEEIDVLFADCYQFELNEEQIEYIYTLTEGWIIAIQMIWQQLKMTGALEVELHLTIRSLEELFRYLALEVFSKQPESIQQFLKASSIFEEFDVSFCNQILKRTDAQTIIGDLVAQKLFIIPVGSEQYRYHPLFRDFLIKRLRQDELSFRKEHRQAADYYLDLGNYEKAIYHYQEIEENFKIGDILERYGQVLLNEGKLEAVSKIFDRLSLQVKNEYSKLWFIEGEINRYFCYYEKAFTCYRHLEELAELYIDPIANSLAQEGKAKIYLDTIQPAKADSYLSHAIELMDQGEENVERQILLYSLMAENLVNLGKATEAEQWLKKCKKVQPNFNKVEIESRFFLRTGRLQEARTLLESSKVQATTNQLSQSHRESDLILSIICSFMGDLEKGKRLAEKAILSGTTRKSPFAEACGWIRMGHIVQLDERYDEKLAMRCYETGLKLMETINMSRGKSEAYMGLTVLYGRLGDEEKANKMAMMALEEPNRVKDYWLASCVRLSHGISFVYSGNISQAKQLIKESYKGFTKCGDTYGIALTTLWLAELAYMEKNTVDFTLFMNEFLQLVKDYDYDFILKNKTLFGPKDLQVVIPLLLAAKEAGIQEKMVGSLLGQFGYENLSFHPGYTIKVKTLGEFGVWLGTEKVKEISWKREKAKELFQLLVTYKGKTLSKDEILFMLWSEQEGEAAQRDLKVALNALNKVIEPQRQVRMHPFFIHRENSFYGLNKEAVIEIDKELFEETIEKALSEKDQILAMEDLECALKMYQGDYLPSRHFDDWCLQERNRLLLLYLRGAEKMARIHLEKDEYMESIKWCERILLKDPCWEEAYRIQMYAYSLQDNRIFAIRTYETCKKKLQDELGVEPQGSTKSLYNKIKSDLPFAKEYPVR